MKRLTSAQVHAQKVAELGLDANALDLGSVEAIAGALRRAAGFLCPCAATTLVRAVVRPLLGLVEDLDTVKDLVEATLEALVGHGDIIEQRDVETDPGQGGPTLLYAAPAGFVARASGAVTLLGVASDQLSALPDSIEARIEYVNHVRRLHAAPCEDLRAELRRLGLIEIADGDWMKKPPVATAAEHVAHIDRLLAAAPPSRDVPGLLLLDPRRPVRYYRGRWIEPGASSGRFVARRSQAYGAPLWCVAQLRDGAPERIIDLPIAGSRWRGCDEAWWLQMAIDAERGEPQRFRLRAGPNGTRVMEFFSPVPTWAQRRWDAVGEPALSPGCLFAYRLAEAEVLEEVQFARQALWLDELTEPSR